MGTRADFYIGRGAEAEWLGSIAWDGYPGGIDAGIKEATDDAVYRQAIVLQWTLALVALGLWVAGRREWSGLGLVPRFGWGLRGVLIGMSAMVFAVLRQRREALGDDEALARLRGRMRRLELMLPHSRAELSFFFKLSITSDADPRKNSS